MPIFQEEKKFSALLKFYFGLIAFSLIGSLFSKLTGSNPGWIAPITSALTLFVGVLALALPGLNRLGKRFGVSILWVILLGVFVEVTGIYTGIPFGKYSYSDKWLPVILLPGEHNFPVLLPFAWFLIVGSSFLICKSRLSAGPAIIISAIMATLIDIPMEYVMTRHLGYWQWLDGKWPIGAGLFGAPLLNAVGWFLTSITASMILNKHANLEDIEAPEAKWVLTGYLVLTAGLWLIYELVRHPVMQISR